MTFKGIDGGSFEDAYDRICSVLKDAYKQHQILLDSNKLSDYEKESYKNILTMRASRIEIRDGLKNLTTYLYQHYSVKSIILIDEYDTPIQAAYLGKYYDEMIGFMRIFLGAGLKDNSYLHQSMLTGILRIAKESLFSDLNNLKAYSLLNKRYGEYFGFTEDEVIILLQKTQLSDTLPNVKAWYNGYQVGNTVLYNPWSIVNFIQEQGIFSDYWVNTSDSALIKDLLIKSDTTLRKEFEFLLRGISTEQYIIENFAFKQLEFTPSAIWSLLLMSGYLKATAIINNDLGTVGRLEIPNKEVRHLYQRYISEWLSGVNDAKIFNVFITNLLTGKIEDFETQLKTIMLQTFSIHDIKGKTPEKFFHGFMLGLLAGIDAEQYHIHSNKESGLGRYDIIIAPKDTNKLGVIIEIKSEAVDCSQEKLHLSAKTALIQIENKKYDQSSLFVKEQDLLKIGVAFSGKELAIDSVLKPKNRAKP
jgi:hypothetical protein